jgi:hypothetical protein
MPTETLQTYEVDSILDHKQTGCGQMKYLIHWKGYNNHNNTLEPKENINADKLLKAYWNDVEDCAKHAPMHQKHVRMSPKARHPRPVHTILTTDVSVKRFLSEVAPHLVL